MFAKSGGLLAVAIGACLVAGLGGAYAMGPPDHVADAVAVAAPKPVVATPSPMATPTSTPTPTPTATPLTLASYVVAADAVCNAAFSESQAVNLSADQQLANALATRETSASLEVRTAQALLDLPRPADPVVAPVPAALTAHRDAYAAIAAAAKDDGRTVEARGAAVAAVEGAAAVAATASGKAFADLGSTRCAAWLNPAALKDSGAS